jgi:hypothetical protein
MNEAPRRTLRELIERHGPGLCSDARRCEGLLRDLCGEHRREINILVGALRERVPLDLLAGRNSVPAGLLLTRLSKRLEEHLALTEEASWWAVGSWALALGVVSEAELRGLEARRAEAARPRAEEARPRPEGRTQEARPPAGSPARPPAPQPPVRRSPPPPAARPPAAPIQASRPPAPPRAPSPPQAADAGRLQTPPADADTLRGRGRRRGCLIGCLLLLLLCVLLFVGGPFVLSILREEQQQRSIETSPGQTR